MIKSTPDAVTFAALAAAAIKADPVRNNVIANRLADTIAGGLGVPGARWFTIHDPSTDSVVGIAMHIPPHPLFIGPLPPRLVDPAMAELARFAVDLCAGGEGLPGVQGMAAQAGAFAREWAALTGATASVAMEQLIYEAQHVIPPVGVAGSARVAHAADADLLVAWLTAFHAEAAPGSHTDDLAEVVRRGTASGDLLLWSVEGRAVSMAGICGPVTGTARVIGVFTPPQFRGHGYAGAVTSAATELGFARGADRCALHTNKHFAASNRIYQRLGYHPIDEAIQYRFS